MTVREILTRQKFLIVAGASKSGTTSVFNYLANHPQIRATTVKETRFFLDADYPLTSEKRLDRDGPHEYLSFFNLAKSKDDAVWSLEATPDYLYSAGTAALIREFLPNARLIFVLREPVSRLLSFYRFGVAMGEIPSRMTLDEFIRQQENGLDAPRRSAKHPAYHALSHGLYSTYLKPFFELFCPTSIHVGFYEDLCRSPLEFMKRICRFAGIDEGYFDGFTFAIANKGVNVRSPFLHNAYWRSKQRIRSYFRSAPFIRSALRTIGGSVDSFYEQANVTSRGKISMSRRTDAFLRDYYKDEAVRLREMLGREIPWPESPQPAS